MAKKQVVPKIVIKNASNGGFIVNQHIPNNFSTKSSFIYKTKEETIQRVKYFLDIFDPLPSSDTNTTENSDWCLCSTVIGSILDKTILNDSISLMTYKCGTCNKLISQHTCAHDKKDDTK